MSKFYNYNVTTLEREERAAFCGGKAALILFKEIFPRKGRSR
jgi:hypothetical protein